jgi:hypothetical protein
MEDRHLTLPILGAAAVILCIRFWRDERLWLLALVLTHLLTASVLWALAGNQTNARIWQTVDWTAILLLLAALYTTWEWLSFVLKKAMRQSSRAEPDPGVESNDVSAVLVHAWVAACVMVTGLVITRTTFGPSTSTVITESPTAKIDVLAKVRKEHPDETVRTRADLIAAFARTTHRRVLLPAGFDSAHFLGHYRRKSYDRWVLTPERADVDSAPCDRGLPHAEANGQLERLEPLEPLVWVTLPKTAISGLSGEPYLYEQAVAAVPLKAGLPDWDRLVWFRNL